MRIRGFVHEDDGSGLWLVEVPALDAMTQGESVADAKAMARSLVADMLFDVTGAPEDVRLVDEEGAGFALEFDALQPVLALIVARTRAKVGLSQAELAARLNSTKNAVGQVEQGRVEPGWSKMTQLVNEMGFDIEINLVPRRAS
jgi:DNA-binding XRE family transcriptional regulator/predicted RNase H-like HicB family nuclease